MSRRLLGGIVRIGPDPWQIQTLSNIQEGVWVLADSGQPKDTMKHLRRCKHDRLELYSKLGNSWNCVILRRVDARGNRLVGSDTDQ